MLLTIVQLVVIIILCIVCLASVLRIYYMNNFGKVVVKLSGGAAKEKPKLTENVNKFKSIWVKLKVIRKPLEYYGKNTDPKYTEAVYNTLTSTFKVHINNKSLMLFCSALGASSVIAFGKACVRIARNIKELESDFTTFITELVPAIEDFGRKFQSEKNMLGTIITQNYDNLKYIAEVIIREKWVENQDIIDAINKFMTLDPNTFSMNMLDILEKMLEEDE